MCNSSVVSGMYTQVSVHSSVVFSLVHSSVHSVSGKYTRKDGVESFSLDNILYLGANRVSRCQAIKG